MGALRSKLNTEEPHVLLIIELRDFKFSYCVSHGQIRG